MSKRLQDKLAVITGETTGIGFATAKHFLDEGARVVLTGRNPETLKIARAELGDRASVIASDASKEEDVKALFQKVAQDQRFGRGPRGYGLRVEPFVSATRSLSERSTSGIRFLTTDLGETKMRTIKVNRSIPTGSGNVWNVLADFPNIANWNRGVQKSFATSKETGGVGAKRHCDLVPMGELEETITGWEEGSKMVVRIDSAKGLPMSHGQATFTVSGDASATEVAIDYSYEPKFGVIGQLMGRFMLDGQLTKGFRGFLKDLDAAARKIPESGPTAPSV